MSKTKEMTFGKYLSKILRDASITQRRLAELMEMDTSYLNKILSDKMDTSPSSETIERIVRALDHYIHDDSYTYNLGSFYRDDLYRHAQKIPLEVEEMLLKNMCAFNRVRELYRKK